MKRPLILAVATVALIAIGLSDVAHAGGGSLLGSAARQRAQCISWNAGYYNGVWGMPLALAVPPTAERQVNWGWGVGNTRVTPICYQFGRNYPGAGQYDRGMYRPMPPWPSDTLQFGVYYVRGPW